MNTVQKDKVFLDDILANFSVYGRYHMLTVLFVMVLNVSNHLYFSNYVFVAPEVGYQCKDSSFNGLLNDTNNSSKALTGCGGGDSECREWVYDDPNSFVAEFDLACQEWKRTLVGSVHSFGYMIGLLLVGPLSDRFGRKILIVGTGVLGAACGLARSFVTNYWLYVSLEFLEALVGDTCSPTYMLTIELVAPERRVVFTTIAEYGFAIGGMLFPLTSWLVPYWRTFLRVLYAPGLLFILYLLFIDESPRWLLIKGKKDAAVSILQKAARKNKIELDADDLKNIYYTEGKGANFIQVLTVTFKSKAMLKRFFVCSVWWIATTFVHQGLSINSVTLQGNKYLNYAMTSFVDIPATLIIAVILIKFKRKVPLVTAFLACAALCVCQPYVPDSLSWLSITMYMASKVMSTFFFTITYIFTSELFPTYIRNSMHALCSSVGRIGSILTPQTPLLLAYWSGLPATVFGLVSLTAGLLTFLVPDTADNSLPDTMLQAETLEKPSEDGKKQVRNRRESFKL